ncbi:helix-turn-helix domain-containing protein [Lactococcus raffinolactis]|uniref:helix-turn-helix domain-containing protein n=1 Tax=Pseudolactococcus raffinolactis TaxID=1366 RepID=UPI0039AFCB76
MEKFITEKQKVIDEIESRLMTFDLSEIGKLTGVPFGLYQRFFSYMYDITIFSYVRKRKLTISASKLLLGEWSVTTASLECGYEDSSSFSRAFKELFQVPPSAITIEQFEKFQFEKISLSNLSNKPQKATLVSVEYPTIQEQYLIGITTKKYPGKVGAGLWEMFWERNLNEKLYHLAHQTKTLDDYIAIGHMSDFENSNSLGKEYMIGRLFHDIPSDIGDFEVKKLESIQLVHSKIEGKSMDDIIDGAYALTSDIANKNGYEIDYSQFFWMEYYNNESFGSVNENPNKLVLDFYMPCKKVVVESGGIQ